MILAMSAVEISTLILVLAFLFLGFKILETTWSYRITKPYAWETSVKQGIIPKKLKRIERFYRDKVRFYFFWLQIERLKKENIDGAFAELGVYKGDTARIIHEMDPSRDLHLFDTFEGFDQRDLEMESILPENKGIDFSDARVEAVKKFIGGNNNITFYKGYFPESAVNPDVHYALVHLDADLYRPTIAALNYFYSRLSPGGVIIIHDYNHTWNGVQKAVAEFLPGIPEHIVELSDWQGSVVIVKNKK